MYNEDFTILERPYNEGEGFIEEIKGITRWRFTCERPIDTENENSSFMLKWSTRTEDNRFIYQGEIREGYIYQELCENGAPSLDKTKDFIKDQLISKENFSQDCIFIPYITRSNNSLVNILNSDMPQNMLLRLLSSSGVLNLGTQGSLSNILNESFIEELERAKNKKNPTSKDTLENLEILTADENLLKKYVDEDTSLKDKVRTEIAKEVGKDSISDQEIYKEVLKNWRESQSNGIRCAMCLEFVKIGEKVVRLPCKNKEGNETPHYFHYIEQDEEGNPKSDNCVGCGVMEWLKDHNTCPCCRFELPIEDDKKNNELNNTSNVDNDENENNEVNTGNLQTPPQSDAYQEDLLRSILGLVANNGIGRNIQNSEPCQCHRCVERRREEERLENMTEQERVEEQLLREAIRRSGNNELNNELNRTHEGLDGEMMTEEEAIEEAIRASLMTD